MIAFLASLFALQVTRRFTSDRSWRVFVYLTPERLLQVDLDDQSLLARLHLLLAAAFGISIASYFLFTAEGAGSFAFSAGFVIAAGVLAIIAIRKKFNARNSSTRPADALAAEGHPWSLPNRVTLTPEKDDVWRLRVWREASGSMTQYLVDADVRCTPAQAHALKVLLCDWMAASHRAVVPMV
jgi:hypothetical protein